MVPVLQVGHGVGQTVVTPSQVTWPLSPRQARFTPEQLVALTLLSQVTVPDSQFAVAVQRDFSRPIRGRLAARSTRLGRAAQEAVPPGGARITASASGVRGARLGAWAKPATETKRRAPATHHDFFISLPPES